MLQLAAIIVLGGASATSARAHVWHDHGIAQSFLGSAELLMQNISNHPLSAAEVVQVRSNAAGDFAAFLSALTCNGAAVVAFGLAFVILRHWYPLVYSRSSKGSSVEPGRVLSEWFPAGFSVSTVHVEKVAGLDSAMLLEFCDLCIRIMATIGLPMVFIMCPLHAWTATAHGDRLGSIGMANIGHDSWLYWIHAVLVVIVVMISQEMIVKAQGDFVKRRQRWLLAMPAQWANSLFVDGIPEEYRSDSALRDFFERLFPGTVARTFVVRKTATLLAALDREKDAEAGSRAEADAKLQVHEERRRIQEGALTTGSKVYAACGFVTFKTRRDAEVALRMKLTDDGTRFVMSPAPNPEDVIYADLAWDTQQRQGLRLIGHACIGGLFLGFVPFVVSISAVTNLRTLRTIGIVDTLVSNHPALEALLEGVFSTLALTIFMSFLPTALRLILARFFALGAKTSIQVHLQCWNFRFLTVFVLLVTVVGRSLLATAEQVVAHPGDLAHLLAITMPGATHFYLSYVLLQWSANAFGLVRAATLLKFRALCLLNHTKEEAKELSEPEDPDYHGIGSRSARLSLIMAIGLVFSNLSPLVTLVSLANFAVCRSVYGFLLAFVELPKRDLGGVFWCAKLRHLHFSLVLYVVLMIGVLAERSSSNMPWAIAAASLLWLVPKAYRLHADWLWETLPLEKVVEGDSARRRDVEDRELMLKVSIYTQPELELDA
eukprot:gnl/TRDRNA2_/TRDRNA2_171076_c0_seq1.p1 gnl/TRDRNA2_/TRDRNA2_171076_c0~~gnl/TRDRNA2_/TRDRNA2_171076_c0_seq1.p1  ORF type:complete len:741 (+),score=113.03 gnl/TRDRNA2_/TRDRNA2_171076_c0_seq1:75-2225(+)